MKYILIPMSKISDEAREIAVQWLEAWSPGFNINEKHKLASDIMNYANRRVKDISLAFSEWLFKKDIAYSEFSEEGKKDLFQQFVEETYKA